jgi:hypothetical protein
MESKTGMELRSEIIFSMKINFVVRHFLMSGFLLYVCQSKVIQFVVSDSFPKDLHIPSSLNGISQL